MSISAQILIILDRDGVINSVQAKENAAELSGSAAFLIA